MQIPSCYRLQKRYLRSIHNPWPIKGAFYPLDLVTKSKTEAEREILSDSLIPKQSNQIHMKTQANRMISKAVSMEGEGRERRGRAGVTSVQFSSVAQLCPTLQLN